MEVSSVSSNEDGRDRIARLTTGMWVSQALMAGCRLRIADHLVNGPLEVSELASRTNSNPCNLYRLLRALSSVGIFEEMPVQKVFRNNELSELLTSDHPSGMKYWVELYDHESWTAWGNLFEAVKQGRSAMECSTSCNIFEFLSRPDHAERASTFDKAMQAKSKLYLERFDAAVFAGFKKIIDIGGGLGTFLQKILDEHPEVTGVVFDQADMIARALQCRSTPPGEASRLSFESGNFFEEVPAGGDAYVLKWILHDWDDDSCRKILTTCRQAMIRGCGPSELVSKRLFILDRIVPTGNTFSHSKWFDLNMMVICPGRERMLEEFESLLASSGFKLVNVILLELESNAVLQCTIVV
mmetsp:Transcript_15617/g.26930  ORF Transcript_15617/g.26930 Transcript_15617/m.26930 type:complete len:355 (-) Transcript_15617:336-1400(-)|eukprot:CAMPEP_0196660912 /NCGR_PEP_ID=MMETSP1086-20130531/41839_1 /TAXON_ID=77921 /ORGANISM="Cyanoptyche  gloeocystis , Strain SAG4.97" /LENGTH=354 /DNA_ID=CAMNT_0041995557 /DNA_START=101 /DNA_END=1165 /DNA_ORIENTATION=-